MDADTVVRYARQIALPDIGPEGQARFCRARAVVVGDDLTAETAATYLRAAGVGTVIRSHFPAKRAPASSSLSPLPAQPGEGEGEGSGEYGVRTLAGADVVIRSGFDDDALLGAAARLGVPLIAVHARPDVVDLLSFPRRAPNPDAPVDAPAHPASFLTDDGAAAVLAGTLAAAEALQALLRPLDTGRAPARHLRLPLDGSDPVVQEIPAA